MDEGGIIMLLKKIDTFLQKIEYLFLQCSWAITMVITLLIVTDVCMRFFFNKPLPATWEISEVAMPFIVMVGFAYTLTKGVHVQVTILTDRMPPKVKFFFHSFGNLLSISICSALCYWSWLRFIQSFRMKEEMLAAVEIPWWLGKFAMPVCFALFGLRFLMLFLNDVNNYSSPGKGRVA
jgi:TRAP-type C4-dicarboxylate transport system permease small subunit